MPKVISWQCPRTKRLFALDQVAEYRIHLKRIAKDNRTNKKIKNEEPILAIDLAHAKRTVRTLKELAAFIMLHWVACDRQVYNKNWHASLKIHDVVLSCIEYTPLVVFYSRLSTRGNDYAKDGIITGKIKVSHNYAQIDFFKFTLEKMQIYTDNVGYSMGTFEISLNDWPGIKESVEQQFDAYEKINIVRKLQGKRVSKFKYRNSI